jgi:hypothetical protein
MQTSTDATEFPDLQSHVGTYHAYTKFVLRGVITAIVGIVLLGWITGVL